ncbi:MAG: hypothetical protein IKR15_00740 [Bacteroidales bacterium]|nr:hypothetical protein [Bacteroidales bacterium]
MDKLQELTDRLYNEGLSKGKAEGEAILAKAREDAAAMVDEARKKAEQIILKAEKDAEDLRTKAESDVRTASLQALQATRQDLESLVVAKIADTQVKDALSAPEFIKGIITAVAKNFSAQEQSDIAMVLPESLKAQLEPFLRNELGKVLGTGVKAEFSKKVAGGFTIGPADGSYFISLSDETFRALIGEYLRPATKKLLFGE